MNSQPPEKRRWGFTLVDWLLLAAIAGLTVQLSAMVLGPTVEWWKNRPRPGVQVCQQYIATDGEPRLWADYLLYLPKDYDANRRWPLIVFLHGAGERGHDLEIVRRSTLPSLVEQGQTMEAILLSPQCPANTNWSPETIVKLVEHVSGRFSVDEDRVYLTGYSLGGWGTWTTAMYDPGRFAAVAPLAGGGDTQQAEQLKDVPIWAFHGDKDTVVPLEATQRMVDAVKKCGGQVKFTVYSGVGHGISEMTYQNREFFEWLLGQHRGQRPR